MAISPAGTGASSGYLSQGSNASSRAPSPPPQSPAVHTNPSPIVLQDPPANREEAQQRFNQERERFAAWHHGSKPSGTDDKQSDK